MPPVVPKFTSNSQRTRGSKLCPSRCMSDFPRQFRDLQLMIGAYVRSSYCSIRSYSIIQSTKRVQLSDRPTVRPSAQRQANKRLVPRARSRFKLCVTTVTDFRQIVAPSLLHEAPNACLQAQVFGAVVSCGHFAVRPDHFQQTLPLVCAPDGQINRNIFEMSYKRDSSSLMKMSINCVVTLICSITFSLFLKLFTF
jgi:hypothetical protein